MIKKRHLPQLGALTPLVFVSPYEYGVNHLIADLETPTTPLIWLELAAEDEGDPIAQGNKLAEAINQKLDAKLLTYGMPFAYGLTLLESTLSYVSPVTLALSHAQYGEDLSRGLLKLTNTSACRTILHFDSLPKTFALPEQVNLISANDLHLSKTEAVTLAKNQLAKTEVHKLLKKTKGAYDAFLAELHQQLNEPPHLVPTPDGPRALPGYESGLPPEALLSVLRKNGRYLEALELAVYQLPDTVPEVLVEAGHAYHEQGLHKRLHKLLNDLPKALQSEEPVLYWRLEAAYRLGLEKELRREVTAYLKTNEAPELRALYAGVYAPTQLAEAKRAFEAKPTPFTAFQAGRLQFSSESIDLLKQSVELAEKQGRPYEVVRAAGMLAAKFIFHGNYQEAASWSKWALREFDHLGVKDGHRRLLILNDWVYARILSGDLAGLETLLQLNEGQLKTAYPELGYRFRSTLGDFYLAVSQPAKALIYYRRNLDDTKRIFAGGPLHDMVRTLLELGEVDEAQALCDEHLALVHNSPAIIQARAGLAQGMVLAFSNPSLAQEKLRISYQSFRNPRMAHLLAQTALYLAYSYLAEEDVKSARNIFQDADSYLRNLSKAGLRLLSGPESAFRQVWTLLEGQDTPLELRLLGKQEVWLNGERLELYPQWVEVLTVLAIRQRPLTLEELMGELYGDGGNKNTLKATISRMRQTLPISHHPYSITCPLRADFLDLLSKLKEGNLTEAIRLYSGALFKPSESPCIRETDDMLTESLRRAGLAQNEPEALLTLSELFPNDLGLLEAAHQTLETSDPRAPLVRARVEVVKSDWLN